MKKSKFGTFLLSIVPGCGFMYLGYMKRGLQYMLIFALAIVVAWFMGDMFYNNTWFNMLPIIAMPIIWLYQMFDAMHTVARMNRESVFTPQDDGFFLMNELRALSVFKSNKSSKILAIGLIILGGYALIFNVLVNILSFYAVLQPVNAAIRQYLFPAIIAIALIGIGIKLLAGNKARSNEEARK